MRKQSEVVMNIEEKRKKHAEYMREYNKKNKEKVTAQRKKREEGIRSSPEEYVKFRAAKNRIHNKYAEANREQINSRAKARNWNYNVEKAAKNSAKHYDKWPVRNLLRQREKSAEEKGLPFTITEEWYWQEFEKGCAVTKIPFDAHRSDSPWVAHIDRKIPSNGYVMDNCRLVCACFNLAKKHWSDTDVLKMAKALILTGII